MATGLLRCFRRYTGRRRAETPICVSRRILRPINLTMESTHFALNYRNMSLGIFVAMGALGPTLITSLVVLGMIWIAVLSASFREALAIFAGLAVVSVVLSVLALGPSLQSIRSRLAAPSVPHEENIHVTAPNFDPGAPVDVEADLSAVWAVEYYDTELRRQCQPCREATGNTNAPITVLKYDASTEFLHAVADGVSISIHAVDRRFGGKFTAYWSSELDPGGNGWSAHCGLPAFERGLRVTGFKTRADAEAWLTEASKRMRELGVKVEQDAG
jgi:hypothetical protein